MKLNDLRLKRGQLVDQMRALIDTHEGDAWTDEIEQQYKALDTEQMNLKAKIDRLEKQANLDSELDQRLDIPAASALVPETRAQRARAAVATPEYSEAFDHYLRVGRNNVGREVANALEVGTASEGGNIVPTEMDASLIEYLQDHNEFRQYCTVIQTDSDREFPVESTLGSADWTAEEAAYNESDPAFGQITLSAHKLTRIVKVSEELVMDSIFDLMDYLARNFGKAFGIAEEAAIVAGDNSGKPNGFNTAASTGKTAAGAATVTGDEIIDLYHSLSRPYRRNARFVMADASLAIIRKLKDGDSQYLWQPGLQAGQPDMLLGKPVITSTAMPAMTTGLDSISFGDLSYYYIVERGARQAQVLMELYAGTGQIGYRMFERIDGDLMDTNAIKNLTQA